MGMKTHYTWKFVAKGIYENVIEPDAWRELGQHIGLGLYALLVLFLRVLMFVLFPISLPLLVFILRRIERKHMEGYQARRAAMDADV